MCRAVTKYGGGVYGFDAGYKSRFAVAESD
jgi:hypothetical protein